MNTKHMIMIERIKKEANKYFHSCKAADDWIMIPERLLKQITVDEVAKIQKKIDINGFTKGVVYACARLIENFDQPTIALSIFDESGCLNESVASEYDLFYLRKYRPSIMKGKI